MLRLSEVRNGMFGLREIVNETFRLREINQIIKNFNLMNI